jgi:hypothetical protein
MGLILRSSSLANPGDSVTVKGSTLDWVEGDGNFVYLLNKINSGGGGSGGGENDDFVLVNTLRSMFNY